MSKGSELLLEFCEWFMQKQRRNTRCWKTPAERDAQECPNAHDVAVFLSTRTVRSRCEAGDGTYIDVDGEEHATFTCELPAGHKGKHVDNWGGGRRHEW